MNHFTGKCIKLDTLSLCITLLAKKFRKSLMHFEDETVHFFMQKDAFRIKYLKRHSQRISF